jgi:hypothetical protein
MTLKIANEYGNFDTTSHEVPSGYAFVPGQRLSLLCRKHNIRCVPAVTDWRKYSSRYPAKPVIGGVIVTHRRHPRLLQAIREHDAPEMKRERLARATRRQAMKEQWADKYGFHDYHQPLARALRAGRVDEDTAELLAFKARYRHEFTDYEERYRHLDWSHLRNELSYSEAKEYAREYAQEYTEDEIPRTWPAYLEKYGFASQEAITLSKLLRDPRKAHPIWFKKAEIAVRGMNLAELTYGAVSEAVRLHS